MQKKVPRLNLMDEGSENSRSIPFDSYDMNSLPRQLDTQGEDSDELRRVGSDTENLQASEGKDQSQNGQSHNRSYSMGSEGSQNIHAF